MERYITTSTSGIFALMNRTTEYRDIVSLGAQFGKVCSSLTYDKDANTLWDELSELVQYGANFAVNLAAAGGLSLDDIMAVVTDNRLKAHAKHGDNSIEAKAGSDYTFWLACLGEEYGEACEATDDSELYSEVIDTITVATAWLSALGRVD